MHTALVLVPLPCALYLCLVCTGAHVRVGVCQRVCGCVACVAAVVGVHTNAHVRHDSRRSPPVCGCSYVNFVRDEDLEEWAGEFDLSEVVDGDDPYVVPVAHHEHTRAAGTICGPAATHAR